MQSLWESHNLVYILAAYSWGVGCLAGFVVVIIRQRTKLRSMLNQLNEKP